MIKKSTVLFLVGALFLANIPLRAADTPLEFACREVVSLSKLVKEKIITRNQPSENRAEFVADQDGTLGHFVANNMQHLTDHYISPSDLQNLHICAAQLDLALAKPHTDPKIHTQLILASHTMLAAQTNALLVRLGAENRHPERTVPAQLSKRQKKLGLAPSVQSFEKKQQQELQAIETQDQAREQQALDEHDLEGQMPDIMSWIMENPRTLALGAFAIYGLLAYWRNWPPFDKKVVEPALANNSIDDDPNSDFGDWPEEYNGAAQSAPSAANDAGDNALTNAHNDNDAGDDEHGASHAAFANASNVQQNQAQSQSFLERVSSWFGR